MKLFHNIYFCLLALMAIGMAGCSDEIEAPRPNNEFKGITLRIPDPHRLAATRTSTRSGDEVDIVEKEGEIYDLYLYAFGADGTFVKRIDLKNIGTTTELGQHPGFTSYDLSKEIEGGRSYRFYVTGNLAGYNALPVSPANEESFKTTILNFFNGDGETATYLLSHEQVKQHGLPMACIPSEIAYTETQGGTPSPVVGGIIDINKNKQCLIHADLTFLCAKVRYTILFDNTLDAEGNKNNGFSSQEFPRDIIWNFKNADALNVYDEGTRIDGINDKTTAKYSVLKLNGNETVYPENPDTYPTDGTSGTEDQRNVNLETITDEYPEFNKQRAWQGTFYIPATVSDSKRPTLSISAESYNVYSESEQKNQLGYEMELLPDHSNIEKGHAYDIVAKVTGVQKMEIANFVVKQWSIENLSYTLQGPVFLHLDKTEVDVAAGRTSKIWYETNASTVSFDSPKYKIGNEEIPLYDITTANDTINIQVNSRIKATWFDEINKNKRQYNFFHIKAGKLYKKVDVSPLLLQRFMTVEPTVWTIDARERLASGDYSGELVVTIRTNVEEFTVSDINWNEIAPGSNLKIYNEDGSEFSYGTIKPKDGAYRLKLKYSGLNSGDKFWQESKSLKFKVSVDNGTLTPGEGYIFPQEVTVNIVPANDNYIIHFKANGWEWPHIYIYQCLELPASFNKTRTIDGKTINLASKAIGYAYGEQAALAYSFTGKIAFKGWDSPEAKPKLDNYNNWDYKNGFFLLSGDWDPTKNEDNLYYTNVDFFDDLRANSKCNACKDPNPSYWDNNGNLKGGYHKLWPGIMMEAEGDGWFKVELTGIATPGKTLMMFNNGHDGKGARYPGNNEVGIPLFDYPSREGWFDLSRMTFSPTKDGVDISTTRRIYFDNDRNWSQPHIYGWTGSTEHFGAWPGAKMKKDSEGRWYFDIPSNMDNVIFNDGQRDGDKTGDLKITGDNRYNTGGANGTIGGSDPNPGGDPSDSNTYRIYFKYNQWGKLTGLNLYNDNENFKVGNTSFDGQNTTATNGGTYYVYSDGWVYLQFKHNNLPQEISFASPNDNKWGTINKNTFIKDAQGVWEVTIQALDQNPVKGGKP